MTKSFISASVFAFLSVQTLAQDGTTAFPIGTEPVSAEPISAEPISASTPIVGIPVIPVVGVPVSNTETEIVTEYENVFVGEDNLENGEFDNGDFNGEDLLPIGADELNSNPQDFVTPIGVLGAGTIAGLEGQTASALNDAYNSVDSNTQNSINNLAVDAMDLSGKIGNDVSTAVSGTTITGTLAPGAQQAAVDAANNLNIDTSSLDAAANSNLNIDNLSSSANNLAGQVSNVNVATTDAASNAMNNIADAVSTSITGASSDIQTVANTVGPLNLPSDTLSNAQNVVNTATVSPAVSNTISSIGNAIQTSLRPSQ